MQHLVCLLSCILWINSCSTSVFFFPITLVQDIFKLTLEKHEICFFLSFCDYHCDKILDSFYVI